MAGDIIVGFPTETDEDFSATVSLVERARYKNCFIFKYSPRPGTLAIDKLPDDVPDAVKRKRNNDLLAIQSQISDSLGREQVGKTLSVFVEGASRLELKRKAATQSCGNGTVSLTIGGRSASPVEHGGSACAIDLEAAGDATGELGHGPIQLSGRTDGDLIVFFDAPPTEAESLVGKIVPIRIDRADRLSLHGAML